MVIADPGSFNISWWTDDNQERRVRVTCRLRLQGRMTIGGGVNDGHDDPGHLILGPTSTTWDPALRYFRLSQVTDDLFDAFRNLYLAVECVLDAICPRQNGMREGAWLRLALQSAAAKGVDLNKYARSGTGSAEDRLYKEIWTDVRNAVFHAKGSQTRYLPLDTSSRPAVQDALLRLGGLFMDIAGHQLGVRFLSSGPSLFAIAAMAEGVVSGTEIALSPGRATLDFNGNAHLPEGPMVHAIAHRAPELDDDHTRFVVASFAAAKVAPIPAIQSLVLMRDGVIAAFEEFEGSDLTLGEADHFEVAFGAELGGVTFVRATPHSRGSQSGRRPLIDLSIRRAELLLGHRDA